MTLGVTHHLGYSAASCGLSPPNVVPSESPAVSTEIAPPNRRLRVVIAVSIGVSLLCIGWWGVKLQWFAAEPDTSEHIVAFEPQTVTLSDGAHARIGLAVVVIGEDGLAPIEESRELVRATLVEHGVTLDVETLRSAEGQNQLRGALLVAVRDVVPEATIDRALLTEILIQ